MDKGILAARDQRAQERILAASQVLAARYNFDLVPELQATGRDKEVVAMKQREAVAGMLEFLADATKPKASGKAA